MVQIIVVAKTTNQGVNWANQNPNASPYAILSVDFPSVNVGYAVGNAGVIRKTINGGTTWTTQSSGLSTDINEVHFFDLTTGVCIGESGKIKRTTNGGSTWSTVLSGTTKNLYDLYFIDANTGFIAGGTGTILKTTNGGLNWTPLTSGTTQWLYAICFKNSLVGYAGGANGTLLKTTDGGATWQPEVSGISIQGINDIVYINNRFIAVATQGIILTDVAAIGITEQLNMDSSIIVFPNPASDNFSINFDKITNSIITIDIVDMNGVLIKSELLKKNQQTFNTGGLSDGVYIIVIKTNEILIKKKLIIKR